MFILFLWLHLFLVFVAWHFQTLFTFCKAQPHDPVLTVKTPPTKAHTAFLICRSPVVYCILLESQVFMKYLRFTFQIIGISKYFKIISYDDNNKLYDKIITLDTTLKWVLHIEKLRCCRGICVLTASFLIRSRISLTAQCSV